MLSMTGSEYAQLITRYIYTNYHTRGIKIYREVFAGKTIIGKNRRIDVFIVAEETNQAYAIECKFQGTQGTADEKILYSLEDIQALRMGGCIAYAGEGWSPGVLHMLRASPFAAYCMPGPTLAPSESTKELDHLLAMHFHWWDVITRDKKPYRDIQATKLDF